MKTFLAALVLGTVCGLVLPVMASWDEAWKILSPALQAMLKVIVNYGSSFGAIVGVVLGILSQTVTIETNPVDKKQLDQPQLKN
jgi:hypothetical protein